MEGNLFHYETRNNYQMLTCGNKEGDHIGQHSHSLVGTYP